VHLTTTTARRRKGGDLEVKKEGRKRADGKEGEEMEEDEREGCPVFPEPT